MNDPLTSYLNQELPRTTMEAKDHWYATFIKYRNQIMHRILYLIMLEPGRDFIPDDPTILDEPKYIKINGLVKFDVNGLPLLSNYSHRREPRTYCRFCFNKVLEICEQIHDSLQAKVH